MTNLVIDVAWTKPDPKAVVAAGYSGVIGYLSRDTTGKNLTREQIAAYHAAGLSVALVWETTAQAAAGGEAQAVKDARDANAEADALGWPGDRPIFYATDFDAQPPQVLTYYLTLTSEPGRPVGCYGGIRVVDAMLGGGHAVYGWQTVAWSGGLVSAIADLYQREAHTRPSIAGVSTGSYDEDIALQLDWGQTPAPAAPQSGPHGTPPAGISSPCWWDRPTDGAARGWRDVHNVDKNARDVFTPSGAAMAYVDDGHTGWRDVHALPAGTTHVLHFAWTPTGWKAMS